MIGKRRGLLAVSARGAAEGRPGEVTGSENTGGEKQFPSLNMTTPITGCLLIVVPW